jgi:peptide/nickel transport system substrate-binding protein
MRYKIVFLAVFSVLIIRCGKTDKKTTDVDLSKPQYGGTLTYAKSGPPLTLDPALSKETESSVVVANIFEGLVEQRAGRSGIDPCLAKSWTISKDGLEYVFLLRPGMLFHDGTPVNAEAVAFSFESQYNEKHPNFSAGRDYAWKLFNLKTIVKTIDAVNDSTVRFKLFKPDATFLSILTLNSMAIISPTAMKKYGKDFYKNPVGAGPFRFQSWSNDGVVALVSFDQYWNGRAYLDTVIFKPVTDAHTRWQTLKSGEANMMGVPDKADMADIENTPGIKIVKQPGLNISYMAMNMQKKPFNDIRVRKAIVLGIDRDKLVQTVYGNFGRPAKNPIPPVLTGYNEEIRSTPFDPNESKKLLIQAGFAAGFKTTLWTMPISREYMPEPDKTAKMIQNDLKNIGIELEIITFPWQTYLEKIYRGEHDMAIVGWIADIPDPDNFFYPLLDKDIAKKLPSTNIAFYADEDMHQLIMKGRSVADPIERSNLYKKACEKFNQDLPWMTIAHANSIVPMKDNVIDFQLHSTSIRKFKTVWIAK